MNRSAEIADHPAAGNTSARIVSPVYEVPDAGSLTRT